MADGIVNFDEINESNEGIRTYTEIFGYILDENHNPINSPADGEPIIVIIGSQEYELSTNGDGYFRFDDDEIKHMSNGTISIFDGNRDTLYNTGSVNYAFSSLAKTRLNIKLLVEYKRVNPGSIPDNQLVDKTVTITVDNGSDLVSRLTYDIKNARTEIIEETPSINGNVITLTARFGYTIKFTDPTGEYYDYTLTLNEENKTNYTIHLVKKTNDEYSPMHITLTVYGKKDRTDTESVDITVNCSITVGEDEYMSIPTSGFDAYPTDVIIINNPDYVSGYVIVEEDTYNYTVTLYSAASSGYSDEEWHPANIAIPWYADKIDVKYNAIDIYSGKTKGLQHMYVNILPYSDTSCTSDNIASVILKDGTTRPSRPVNNLFYTENEEINENLYQFLIELKKECYPAELVKSKSQEKTLELHTFIPTEIELQQRKNINNEFYQYQQDTDPVDIIGNYIDITYNGDEKESANTIINAKATGFTEPWNKVELTSNSTVSLNNVYISPADNILTSEGNITKAEKQEHISKLSVIYNNIICHSESYVFPYIEEESTINNIELIYGKENTDLVIGPLKYQFTQDEETNTYTISEAQKYNYIPKLTVDNVYLGNVSKTFSSSNISGSYLTVKVDDLNSIDTSGTLTVNYHMNDDEHTVDQKIETEYNTVSSPEVRLYGYSFNNTTVKNFSKLTSDPSITASYFLNASNNLIDYNFILYTKSSSSIPENDIEITINNIAESYDGTGENNLRFSYNISLTKNTKSSISSDRSDLIVRPIASVANDIYYKLTDIQNGDNFIKYISSVNNTNTNNILVTYYTTGLTVGIGNVNGTSQYSYSYINDIIEYNDVLISYKTNKESYMYNVSNTTEQYSGKYYIYNDEAFNTLYKYDRWNNNVGNNIYQQNNSPELPNSSNKLTISSPNNKYESVITSLYNITDDGKLYMPTFINNTSKIELYNGSDKIFSDKFEDIKGFINTKTKHNYLTTYSLGQTPADSFLISKFSTVTNADYIGPETEKESNNIFSIKYGNGTSNTINTMRQTIITNMTTEATTGASGDHSYDYDYSGTEELLPSDNEPLNTFYEKYNNGSLNKRKNIKNANNTSKQFFTDYLDKYDELKDIENYNSSYYIVYHTEENTERYNSVKDFISAYSTAPSYVTSMAYLGAQTYILSFTYSYLTNNLSKYNSYSGLYKVQDVSLNNTIYYNYSINNTTVNLTETSTKYSDVYNAGSTNSNLPQYYFRNYGQEYLYQLNDGTASGLLSIIYNYNNSIKNLINQYYSYIDGNPVTLSNIYSTFNSNNIELIGPSATLTDDANFINYINYLYSCNLKLNGYPNVINYYKSIPNFITLLYQEFTFNLGENNGSKKIYECNFSSLISLLNDNNAGWSTTADKIFTKANINATVKSKLFSIISDWGNSISGINDFLTGDNDKVTFPKEIYQLYYEYSSIYSGDYGSSTGINSSILSKLNKFGGNEGSYDLNHTNTTYNLDNLDNNSHLKLLGKIYNIIQNYLSNINSDYATYINKIREASDQFDSEKIEVLNKLTTKTTINPLNEINSLSVINSGSTVISDFFVLDDFKNNVKEYNIKEQIKIYLKRAIKYVLNTNGEENNSSVQTILSGRITEEAIKAEIDAVHEWYNNYIISIGKTSNNYTVKMFSNTSVSFNTNWLRAIEDYFASVQTIYGNGFNIYTLSKNIDYNVGNVRDMNVFPEGLHLRYIINNSINEITTEDNVYNMSGITKFNGTIYQTYEELASRTKNIIHFLLYYYDGFIKEVKVYNNILDNANIVSNIGYNISDTSSGILITFNSSELNYNNIDTTKNLYPVIELKYYYTGADGYTSPVLIYNNNGYYYNLICEENKLYHIKYRLCWKNDIFNIKIYSSYNDIVFYYDPENDGYDYNKIEFNISGNTEIPSNISSVNELQLFTYSNGKYFVADYNTSDSSSYVSFKFIKTVNGETQVIEPDLISNYDNYNLEIIDDKKYVLTKINE